MYTFKIGARHLAARFAALCLITAAAASGCTSAGSGSYSGNGSNPADGRTSSSAGTGTGTGTVTQLGSGDVSATDPITLQRAQYVETMLNNSYASGPQTEGTIMSVISGYGGGYVLNTSLSGTPGPSEKLTLTVVIGPGTVLTSMQGESVFAPTGIACFTYTAGFYGYQVTAAQILCPSTVDAATAQAVARRQLAAQVDSEHYDTTPTQTPTSLAEAEQAVDISGTTTPTSPLPAPLTAADFATGTDGVQHKPDAGLAVPQSNGSCLFIAYRWIQASWIRGGKAGTAASAVSAAWVAPTGTACTGSEALAAGAFLTVDSYAGG